MLFLIATDTLSEHPNEESHFFITRVSVGDAASWDPRPAVNHRHPHLGSSNILTWLGARWSPCPVGFDGQARQTLESREQSAHQVQAGAVIFVDDLWLEPVIAGPTVGPSVRLIASKLELSPYEMRIFTSHIPGVHFPRKFNCGELMEPGQRRSILF